jgi:hypothetical protein
MSNKENWGFQIPRQLADQSINIELKKNMVVFHMYQSIAQEGEEWIVLDRVMESYLSCLTENNF